MKYTLTILIALLPVPSEAAPAPSFDCSKASTVIEGVICSDSALSSVDADMGEAYWVAHESLTGNLKALLRNNQRRWLKIRDGSCEIDKDFVPNNEIRDPGHACLMSIYQKRIWALKRVKRFAIDQKEDPRIPVFLPMELSDREVDQLEILFSETRYPSPDGYLKVDRGKFLVPITNTAPIGQGLYFADIRHRKILRLIGGLPDINAFASKDGFFWILFQSSGTHRGVMSTEFTAIHLVASDSGEVKPRTQRLLSVSEDGVAGGCGRGVAIGITTAHKVRDYRVSDIDDDGFEDIVLSLTEVDCATGRTKSFQKKFVYKNGTFIESL